jgi:hypothetical protein
MPVQGSISATHLNSDPFAIPESHISLSVPGVVLCAFSPDGNLLATGTSSGKILIWDILCQSVVRELQGHVAPITVLWSYIVSLIGLVGVMIPDNYFPLQGIGPASYGMWIHHHVYFQLLLILLFLLLNYTQPPSKHIYTIYSKGHLFLFLLLVPPKRSIMIQK